MAYTDTLGGETKAENTSDEIAVFVHHVQGSNNNCSPVIFVVD